MEPYTPFKDDKGQWWFNNWQEYKRGPYLTEEFCIIRAEQAEEREAAV